MFLVQKLASSKGLVGIGNLVYFHFLKINGMAGALRTKSQVVYDEARETVKTPTVFILKRVFESELRI